MPAIARRLPYVFTFKVPLFGRIAVLNAELPRRIKKHDVDARYRTLSKINLALASSSLAFFWA